VAARPPSGNRKILAGIGAVALLVVAAIVLLSRGGDDPVDQPAPAASSEATPTSPAVVTPGDTAPSAETSDTACLANIYVTTGDGTITVIDTASNSVINTISVGADPRGLAVTSSGSKAYVADFEASAVMAVDLTTGSTVATIELSTPTRINEIIESYEPAAVAMTPDGTKVYVLSYYGDTTFSGGLWVIDAATDTLRTQVNLAARPLSIAVSPDGLTAYVTSPDQQIFVVDTATDAVIDTIIVDGRPDGVAFSADGATAYVADRVGASLWVIDTATLTVLDTIGVSEYPVGIAVSPDGSAVYVSSYYGESVDVIAAAANTVIATVEIGETLTSLDVAPDGSSVYALDYLGNVWGIDTATNTLQPPIQVGGWSQGIAVCDGAP